MPAPEARARGPTEDGRQEGRGGGGTKRHRLRDPCSEYCLIGGGQHVHVGTPYALRRKLVARKKKLAVRRVRWRRGGITRLCEQLHERRFGALALIHESLRTHLEAPNLHIHRRHHPRRHHHHHSKRHQQEKKFFLRGCPRTPSFFCIYLISLRGCWMGSTRLF